MRDRPQPVPSKPRWRQLREMGGSPDLLLRSYGVESAPVDVHNLCRYLEVRLHPQATPGWDGALMSSEARADIWFDAGDPLTRQRFTIAHELGHLMLHPLGTQFRDTFRRSSWTPQESQANRFAARLLMPEWLLLPAVDAIGADASDLANAFQVSLTTMQIRLGNVLR